jgi:hypothetical protein
MERRVVVRALLLASSLLLGCTRDYEDVPQGPLPATWLEVKESRYVYNPTVFRGNDVHGKDFGPTVCPDGQVIVGLDVYVYLALVRLPLNSPLPTTAKVPIAMVLKCAWMDELRNIVPSGETRQIGDIPTTGTERIQMDCDDGSVAITLRGAEDPWRNYPRLSSDWWVSAIGIECANAKAWKAADEQLPFLPATEVEAELITNSAMAGHSTVGTSHFADTCPKPFFVLNGIAAHFEDRLEQIYPSCATTPIDWDLFQKIEGQP